MEATLQPSELRPRLEERIKALEAEKANLSSDIAVLREKLALLELERRAITLESEVEALRLEKRTLEEEVVHQSGSGAVSGEHIDIGSGGAKD